MLFCASLKRKEVLSLNPIQEVQSKTEKRPLFLENMLLIYRGISVRSVAISFVATVSAESFLCAFPLERKCRSAD